MTDDDTKPTIFEICKKVEGDIIGDFGGGSPLPKTFLMAYLIQEQQLKSFVEIGVYRGRSLFSVAYSIFLNGGTSFGVDPYSLGDAREKDTGKELKEKIDSFLEGLDFDTVYRDVLEYREKCGYGESIKIVRSPANTFFSKYPRKQTFDIAHIDGNHDTKFVRQDFEHCHAALTEGGFIVFDDIDWKSVRTVYEEAKQTCPVVFESEQFGILMKGVVSVGRDLRVEKLTKKLKEVYATIQETILRPSDHIPTVSVGVLSYNQSAYIEECLESVFAQTGNFKMNVVICDDSSTDGTDKLIEAYLARRHNDKQVSVTYIHNQKNLGMVRNFQQLISLLGESDYFTFCEGDDYYLSSSRIAQHLLLQQRNPQFSVTYNRLIFFNQESAEYEMFKPTCLNKRLTTEDLAKENVIGNLNCVFYNSRLLSYVQPAMFEIFTGDWFLAIFLSQFGSIGLLNKPYNVYRLHDGGVWSGMDVNKRNEQFLKKIDEYNRYLNFTYDEPFTYYKRGLHVGTIQDIQDKSPLCIVDDISPHPISGFRYEEFTSILRNIPGSRLYTTGENAHVLGTDSIHDLIIDYKRKNPDLAAAVETLSPEMKINTSLLYCTFLGNALDLADRAEAEGVPFIFTLYPGGLFALNNERSDSALARVTGSPYFRKVIVTQKVTYDYLIEKKFCSPDKIEYIWGVVVPSHKLDMKVEKQYHGLHKKTLDICFVAHKYSEHGQDKGYDVFLDVARQLSKDYDNVRFHVVGPWDKNILDTEGIHHIKYYGVRGQDWFDTFYKDKDIMLSPNINSKIFEGSFDGFPTGAATDASLRKVAMFVTDPLKLNDNHFVDGNEIVIIKHDVSDIVSKIKHYIDNPEKLQSICEAGYKKTNTLYSCDAQIRPRLRVLKRALKEPFEPAPQAAPHKELTVGQKSVRMIKRRAPRFVKKTVRKLGRLWAKLRAV